VSSRNGAADRRSLTGRPEPQHSDHVILALAVLAGTGYVTLLFELPRLSYPVEAAVLGAVYVIVAVLAFRWIDARGARRRRIAAAAYIPVLFVLAYLVYGAGEAGFGATLLVMVLVSQSVLLLPLPAAALVVVLLPFFHLGMTLLDGLANGLPLFGAAVFTAVVTELLRRERRARSDLAVAHERLREYAAQAEELATIQERNRLARDIHDGLGHHLTVVQMQIQAARAVLGTDPEKSDAVLAQAQQQATDALAEVRRSVAALREVRTRMPLSEALKELTEETSAAGVPTRLEIEGTVRALSPEVEEALYRTAQEGLTNVRKHAEAWSAGVVLDYTEPATVRLEVRDDGRGLPGNVTDTGFGLLGLTERAFRLGGRLAISSSPGQGTTVLVEVPG
jgi:signal transduction histidine kinase